MKKTVDLLKKTFSDWSEDKASRLAAGLAYYTAFSLAPLLVLLISLLGMIGVHDQAQTLILDQVQDLAGEPGRLMVENMIAVSRTPRGGVLASILGTVALLFGALGVFGELQDSLNTIWEVKPKPQAGFLAALKNLFLKRLLSFAMLVVIGFILVASLAVSAGLAALNEWLSGALPLPEFVMLSINFLISFGVITLLFASIFKILPDADIAWRDVWLGAAVTSLLFSIGKLLIGLYLGNSNIGTSFGAAGALALLLIWVYYSAQIVFLGAEFTQVYANTYGSRIVPDENAIPVTEEARAQQGIPRRDPSVGDMGQASGIWALQAMQHARTQPGRPEQGKGTFDKVLFSMLLISQFIPALRSLYASKTK